MSLKNPVTPPGIDPGTVRLVAQRLNHYATPGPNSNPGTSTKLPATIRNFFAFLTHYKFSFIIVIPFHSTTHNCCGRNSVIALPNNDYQNQVLCVTYQDALLRPQRPPFQTSSLAECQLCPLRLTMPPQGFSRHSGDWTERSRIRKGRGGGGAHEWTDTFCSLML